MAREVWVLESRNESLGMDWRVFASTEERAQMDMIFALLKDGIGWERRVVRYVPEDEK